MAGKITLVTGGARSGKSSYAEHLAKTSQGFVAYLATAIAFDEGMKDRIKKHQASRPSEWTTYEGYKDVYKIIKEIGLKHQTILLDCVTIMTTNLMFECEEDWENISHEKIDEIETYIQDQMIKLIEEIRKNNIWCIMVTNEVGMGIVPENRMSRIFRDIAGRMNQMIAKKADEVYFTVSGIPMKIK
ncbi:bifunctional adenosylcobinamide kinase/adenosylcobinamide-phosphate guanylyltransferase [Inediibacterium massiliense]|uniref:bifunctional adenosylcobinamide kinase/adenosylcobinamide-phosphate guanylyltransferase n=1 Tax=Inediibacterium massiliense TaxID=1658111 RepID=UPI0006B3FC6C|nr:bifunctional adenosylcobinamide kinase/adenosylcobinamide-phosphate guanylyltransferase [Inediibacterium massiliense]